MKIIYTCGGCCLPYESDTEVPGMERSMCPRCNPGKTFNRAVHPATYPLVDEMHKHLVT